MGSPEKKSTIKKMRHLFYDGGYTSWSCHWPPDDNDQIYVSAPHGKEKTTTTLTAHEIYQSSLKLYHKSVKIK
jgi:hypothetical protein